MNHTGVVAKQLLYSVILHVVAESMSQLCFMSGRTLNTVIDSATSAQNDITGNNTLYSSQNKLS